MKMIPLVKKKTSRMERYQEKPNDDTTVTDKKID